MSDRREALSPEERARLSAAAALLMEGLPEVMNARLVAGYVAARGEIDPAPALLAAERRGAKVVLPRVTDGVPRLRFHTGHAGALRPGRYGLLEPDAGSPEVPVDQIEVFLVPGLAFDGAGGRLGYGGGYYDELATHLGSRATFIGLAYDFQILPHCPTGPGDVPVSGVMTDCRVIRAGGREA